MKGPIFPKSNPWQVVTVAMSHIGWQHTCMRTRLSHFNVVVVVVLIISAKNLINCLRLLIHTTLQYFVIDVYEINHYFYSTLQNPIISTFFNRFFANLPVTAYFSSISYQCTIKYTESDYNCFLLAFVAYLGFINVLVAHSHPVMLVFCQLLIKRKKGRGLEESLPEIQPRESDVESGEGSCMYFLVIYT